MTRDPRPHHWIAAQHHLGLRVTCELARLLRTSELLEDLVAQIEEAANVESAVSSSVTSVNRSNVSRCTRPGVAPGRKSHTSSAVNGNTGAIAVASIRARR
jgi:hypothetical protein